MKGDRALLFESFKRKSGLRRYIGPKRILILGILALSVFYVWNLYQQGVLHPAMMEHYKDQHPISAVFLFVLIYAVFVLAAVPSLPMNLAAGYFWGGALGGVYAALGVTLGGWISFVAARWVLGQPLAERIERRWSALVQEEFDRNGWKFVAFARINPVIPTGPLNYMLGLTSLTHVSFLWVTFVFILPPSIAMAYLGDTLQTFSADQIEVREAVREVLLFSAAVTLFVVLRFVFRLSGKRPEKL